MEWSAFLNDPELNTGEKLDISPNGEYLFRKVSHDVLECLTTYRGYLKIVSALENNNIPENTSHILNRWSSVVDEWVAQITSLAKKHSGSYPPKSPEWANLIAEIGNIVVATPKFKTAIAPLNLPDKGDARNAIKWAIIQPKILELILIDIQNQNYKHLWTTVRYGDDMI